MPTSVGHWWAEHWWEDDQQVMRKDGYYLYRVEVEVADRKSTVYGHIVECMNVVVAIRCGWTVLENVLSHVFVYTLWGCL